MDLVEIPPIHERSTIKITITGNTPKARTVKITTHDKQISTKNKITIIIHINHPEGTNTVRITKRNKFIRIREDIVLFEYITLDAEGYTYKLEKENNFISDSIRLLKQEDEGGDLHQSSDRESVIESEEEDGGQEPENNTESEPAKKRSKLNATDSNSEAKDNTLSEEN